MKSSDVSLLLGKPLKNALPKEALNLFIVTVCGMTMEKIRARRTGKRSGAIKSLTAIATILYKEILRRMKMNHQSRQ